MNGISFLSENLTDTGIYTITTGSENTQFPIENLKLDFTTKKFRSNGNTVVFEIDWQEFRAVDFLTVTGDATLSLGVTAVSIKLSITTDFSASLVYNLNLSAKHNVGFLAIDEVTARYAEVTLTGTGSYSELSKIFIGKKISLENNNLSLSSFKLDRDDNSNVRRNEFGQKFIDIRNSVKKISGSIQTMTKAEMDIVDDLFIYHGRNKPLWVVVDQFGTGMIDGEYILTCFVYFSNDPSYSVIGGQHYNVSMTMELVV